MKHGMNAVLIKEALKRLNKNRIHPIIMHWLPSTPLTELMMQPDQLLTMLAMRIEQASAQDTTNTIPIHPNPQIAQMFEESYEAVHGSRTQRTLAHHLPPLQAPRQPSMEDRTPPVAAPLEPESHESRPPSPLGINRKLSMLMRKVLGSPNQNSIFQNIDIGTIRANLQSGLIHESEDPDIRQVADEALKVFRMIKVGDYFTSKIVQRSGSFVGKRVTISGTGGYETETSALRRGYTTVSRTLIKAIYSGFSVQEAQILAVGMFLHGSDVFYIATKHYRRRFSIVSQPTGTREESPEHWEAYDQNASQLQVAGQMRHVHEEAFKIIVQDPQKAGTERSFAPRIRAIGIDMFEQVGEPPRGPFGAQMMTQILEPNEMWEGEFIEFASLCTGTSVHGCYSAFSATAGYDVAQFKYGLISLCRVGTYNYRTLSPFPQETEWAVPPGGRFRTIVFLRKYREDMESFVKRIFFLMQTKIEIPGLRENILYAGLASMVEEIRTNPMDVAFENLKYYVFMWPMDADINQTSEYTIPDVKMRAIVYV